MCHTLCHFIWDIWWFHRSKDIEVMKAGKLAIRPWKSCPYTEYTLVDLPSSVVLSKLDALVYQLWKLQSAFQRRIVIVRCAFVRHRYMSSKANMTVKCCKKLRSVDNFQTTAYHDGCSSLWTQKKKKYRHLWLKIINAPMKQSKEIGMVLLFLKTQ